MPRPAPGSRPSDPIAQSIAQEPPVPWDVSFRHGFGQVPAQPPPHLDLEEPPESPAAEQPLAPPPSCFGGGSRAEAAEYLPDPSDPPVPRSQFAPQ